MSATAERKAARPQPGQPREYHFPAFERRRFENGLELIVCPVHKLPLVTVAAVFEAGAVCDPAGREGSAQLVAKLLLEGTELDGDAYDAALKIRQAAAVFPRPDSPQERAG